MVGDASTGSPRVVGPSREQIGRTVARVTEVMIKVTGGGRSVGAVWRHLDRLLAAVRHFAQETFALQHRYTMVLHTDQDHLHVHLVLKAVSEQGTRLNIRKGT